MMDGRWYLACSKQRKSYSSSIQLIGSFYITKSDLEKLMSEKQLFVCRAATAKIYAYLPKITLSYYSETVHDDKISNMKISLPEKIIRLV